MGKEGAAGSGKIGISASRHAERSSGEGRFYRRVTLVCLYDKNNGTNKAGLGRNFYQGNGIGLQQDGNTFQYHGCVKHVYIFGSNGVVPLTGRS